MNDNTNPLWQAINAVTRPSAAARWLVRQDVNEILERAKKERENERR
jgi:hypothetical protein